MEKDTDGLDNISFIQYLNRRVLEEAEEAIVLDLPGDDVVETEGKTPEQAELALKKKNILKRRNRMYGLKNPLVWVLEKIADTELKIEKQRPKKPVEDKADIPLDEHDIRLLKQFVQQNTEEK